MILFVLFLKLLVAHAICDYVLQTEWMVQEKYKCLHPLVAHALIQAGGVFLVLGPIFAAIEFVLHFTIDLFKIKKCISAAEDQALHYVTKVGYLGAIILFIL